MRSVTYTYAEMLAARGLAILGSLAVAILTARALGPVDRGRYFYIVTLASIGMQFASLGIQSSNTYLIAGRPALLPQMMANTVRLSIVGGLVAAAGAVAFDSIVNGCCGWTAQVGVIIILTPSMLFFLYLSNMAIALDRTRAFNGLIILNSVASIGLASFAAWLGSSLNNFLFAAAAASVGASALAWVTLSRGVRIPVSFDYPLFWTGIVFAFRAHVAALLYFLMSRMGVMVIRQFGQDVELGYWSIAAQIADALLVLPATISLLLFPSLVRLEGQRRWDEYKLTLLRVGPLMGVLCLVSAAIAHPAIVFVFGERYAASSSILMALLPGIFSFGVASVASQFVSATGFPLSQVVAWICGALFQGALSLVLFHGVGVVGLAWIQSGCAAFVAAWLIAVSVIKRPRKS